MVVVVDVVWCISCDRWTCNFEIASSFSVAMFLPFSLPSQKLYKLKISCKYLTFLNDEPSYRHFDARKSVKCRNWLTELIKTLKQLIRISANAVHNVIKFEIKSFPLLNAIRLVMFFLLSRLNEEQKFHSKTRSNRLWPADTVYERQCQSFSPFVSTDWAGQDTSEDYMRNHRVYILFLNFIS